ncbi:hypothetical protein AB6A40_006548 [Gnathostoma spinigerum]|uniref:Uncharacterized protein n=1 Tax=Gnathostoma spinigerum TaxID=75299 RepID=A0ABD6ENW0_9BILA
MVKNTTVPVREKRNATGEHKIYHSLEEPCDEIIMVKYVKYRNFGSFTLQYVTYENKLLVAAAVVAAAAGASPPPRLVDRPGTGATGGHALIWMRSNNFQLSHH